MHAQDEDLEHTHQLFAQVGKESYPETDISAEQWLRNKGVNDKILAIADACYANDFGCSLHQLGLRDMITENRKWDSGIKSCSLLCCHKQVYHFIAVSLVIHCKCFTLFRHRLSCHVHCQNILQVSRSVCNQTCW